MFAEHIAADVLNDRADEHHHAAEIRVGLVDFEHRELGIVLPGNALVAEDAADLEHAVVAADEQALKPQFKRDAQVEVGAERVVMRHERPRGRAARDAFEHRRFHLEKIPFGERATDARDDAAAQHQARAGLGVDDEVEVALTINLLGVGQAVPLFRERTQGL